MLVEKWNSKLSSYYWSGCRYMGQKFKWGGQAITRDQCLRNVTACFDNPYQKKLIAGMRAEGFCVLSIEPWHFEKPKMSSKCN